MVHGAEAGPAVGRQVTYAVNESGARHDQLVGCDFGEQLGPLPQEDDDRSGPPLDPPRAHHDGDGASPAVHPYQRRPAR